MNTCLKQWISENRNKQLTVRDLINRYTFACCVFFFWFLRKYFEYLTFYWMRSIYIWLVIVGIFVFIINSLCVCVFFFLSARKNVQQIRKWDVYSSLIAGDQWKMLNDQSKIVLMWTSDLIDLKSKVSPSLSLSVCT